MAKGLEAFNASGSVPAPEGPMPPNGASSASHVLESLIQTPPECSSIRTGLEFAYHDSSGTEQVDVLLP